MRDIATFESMMIIVGVLLILYLLFFGVKSIITDERMERSIEEDRDQLRERLELIYRMREDRVYLEEIDSYEREEFLDDRSLSYFDEVASWELQELEEEVQSFQAKLVFSRF